jgi:uncharacterized alpha-E superfamily protein
MTGEFATASVSEVPVLVRALASAGQIEPGFVIEGIREQLPAIEQILPQAVLDEQHAGSLRNMLSALRRVAWTVRDRISVDSWRIIHQLDEEFRRRRRGDDLSGLLVMLNQGLVYLSAFSGLVVESMTRTQGWRFLDLGRRLERSLHTINLVQSGLVDAADSDASVLEAVLEVADSKMTYRSRYLAQMRLAPVLDLLLTDETNPRSLVFQLAALAEHVENLPREESGPLRTPEQRIAASMLHALRMIDAETLGYQPGSGPHSQLERLLSRLAGQLPKLAESISHKYLIHAGPLRQLAGDRRDKSV